MAHFDYVQLPKEFRLAVETLVDRGDITVQDFLSICRAALYWRRRCPGLRSSLAEATRSIGALTRNLDEDRELVELKYSFGDLDMTDGQIAGDTGEKAMPEKAVRAAVESAWVEVEDMVLTASKKYADQGKESK
jgi:hypothetical protein